jgi:hypothetical protein
MSFYKAKTSKEDVKQGGGTGHLVASGCYPVNIIAPFVSVSQNGSTSVDLFLEHTGKQQVLYGNMRITNNDGSENSIGAKAFNQLVIVSGVEEVSEPVDAEIPIGKKGAMADASVLEDLSDIDVILRIQMEYSVYNNNIQEKKVIRGFFRAEDNASAEEIVNGENFGDQFKKESAYFDNVTYKDNLDEDAISAWVAASRPKGTAGGSKAAAAPKPSFGKKKAFGQS